jgi:tetratricopeptide (TPR) repeat protein
LRAQADFYQQFVALRGDDPAFQDERARALVELARATAELGGPEEALAAFERATAVLEGQVRDSPDRPELQLSLAACLSSQALQLFHMERYPASEATYRRGLDIVASLPDEDAKSLRAQRVLTALYLNLGFLLHKASRYPEAQDADDRAIEVGARVAASPAAEADDVARLSTAWLNRGYLNEQWGRAEPALESRQQAVTLAEQLNQRWPGVDEYRKLLASTYQYQGWTLQQFGRPGVEAAYLKALPLRKQLARDHPLRVDYQSDRGMLLTSLAWLYQTSDRPEQAEAHYKEALEVFAGVAEKHPEVPDYQRMLAYTYNDRGWLYHQHLGRLVEAEADYLQCLKWRTKLAGLTPARPDDLVNVASVLENLGELYGDTNRPAEAHKAFDQALEQLQAVARAHPDVVDYARELAEGHRLYGVFLRKAGHPSEALAKFGSALTVLGPRGSSGTDPRVVKVLADSLADRALTLSKDPGRQEDALRDWDRAVEVDGGKTARYRLGHASTLARQGKHAEAAAEAEEVVRSHNEKDALAEAGHTLALAAAAASKAGQAALAETYASRSVALLREAVGKGFHDEKALQTDPELAGVRGRADFQQLLAGAGKKP